MFSFSRQHFKKCLDVIYTPQPCHLSAETRNCRWRL